MTVLEESLYRPVMTTGPFAGRRFVREARIADWMLCTKRIDLVCMRGRHMHAIELKVRDWRGAVRQAYANLCTADYSYVGLWHEAAARADRDALRRSGLGMLEIDKSACRLAVRPRRSGLVLPKYRAYVRSQFG